jgi:Transposase DDE domain
MFANVAQIIRQFKRTWTYELDDEAIRAACRQAGHRWRERELGPVATVKMFLLQILFGNVACNFVPRLAGKKVTGSAYCEARARLPLAALEQLLTRCTSRMAEAVRGTGRWLGHRLFLVDGSGFSMPDTDELQASFGQPGNQARGCGFPVARWLALMHFGSGLFQKVLTAPLRSRELSGTPQLHPELEAGDVLLGDRGFCSYGHLALLVSQGLHGIFRAHQHLIVVFTPQRVHVDRAKRGTKQAYNKVPRSRWIRSLGTLDQIVEWSRPRHAPPWLSAAAWLALPSTLLIRELRYTVAQPGFRTRTVTLVTTLLDPRRYPKQKLAEAYGLRWTIETAFGHLKTTMKMDVLHCRTVEGVLKELTMFLLVYNLVRMTVLEAARRQGVSPARISFTDALRWLATAQPGESLPELLLVPHRPARVEPRRTKRRPKHFRSLQKPRAVLRQLLIAEGLTT